MTEENLPEKETEMDVDKEVFGDNPEQTCDKDAGSTESNTTGPDQDEKGEEPKTEV